MKIYAFNGSPRKNANTAQMLNSFVDGVNSVAPEADVEFVNLYDYTFTGCRSCFACQRKENRDHLKCHIKDSVHDIIDGAFHADGLVFGAPVYFCDISAQTKAFLERLMYPGDSDKVVPTAFIYTMNCPENFRPTAIDPSLKTTQNYLTSTFRQAPELIYSCFTFQYNDNDAFIDGFRGFGASDEKKKHHDEQFPVDLKNAFDAGVRLVERIQAAKEN